MSWLVCASNDERRLTVAKNFVSHDPDSKRGVLEMFDEDQMPPIDERAPSDFLPKHKGNVVQHIRDALLMGTAEIMAPPQWDYDSNPAK
jgi:hypothetical protein